MTLRRSALVVARDPDARDVIARVLDARGHQVSYAEEAAGFWSAFRRTPAELVIVDERAPGVDGLEVCRRLRKSRGPSETSILILRNGRNTPLQAVIGAGATACIEVPVDAEELTERIVCAEAALDGGAPRTARKVLPAADHRPGAAPDSGVLVIGRDGSVIAADSDALHLFGYAADGVQGLPTERLLEPISDRGGALGARVESVLPLDGGVDSTENGLRRMRGRRADGTVFACDVVLHAGVIHPAADRWTAIVRDTSRREFVEAQIRESVKTDALSTLAAGVANDFNNALAAISGSIELASMQLPREFTIARQELAAAKDASRRAARLVRRLMTCARPAPSVRRPVDPRVIIDDCVECLRRETDQRIAIETEFKHGDWRIGADSEQLADIVLSLGQNAADAMPEGGTLTVRTTPVTAPSVDGVPIHHGSAREFVRVDVSDTGSGIPSEILPRIFEPFFTTKTPGRGAGLGLAMVYGVLQQHEGGVTVESRVDAGTTFRLFLPRSTEPPEGIGVGERPPLDTGDRGAVLVVDDQADIRHPIHEVLTQAGYSVLEATDGAEALAVYDREAGRTELVILDVTMPGLSGWDVLRELKQRDPELPVVMMSGYAPGQNVPAETSRLADAFLNKPYTLAKLTGVVRSLLGEDSLTDDPPAN